MIYVDDDDLQDLEFTWNDTIDCIESAVQCIAGGDCAQVLKPYLRYGPPQNRIIAMPAYVGGEKAMAGIKWIASFPGNIDRGLPRAHSVTILNDAQTGKPVAIINSAVSSAIRTASVSGLLMRWVSRNRTFKDIKIGIIGLGPIGRWHLRMCADQFKDCIGRVILHDQRPVGEDVLREAGGVTTEIATRWEDAYRESDVVITCTTAEQPYITEKPKPGALLLNVSLRDYCPDVFPHVKAGIVVDDWDEVCRENTDVEMMHKQLGLAREQTFSLVDAVFGDALKGLPLNQAIMFNPMGLAVFDIAIASHVIEKVRAQNLGREL